MLTSPVHPKRALAHELTPPHSIFSITIEPLLCLLIKPILAPLHDSSARQL